MRPWRFTASGVVMAAAAVAVAAAALSGQTPQTPASPQFRAGIELVTLDVSVLDRNRRPVQGLTKDDFVLLENGVEQPIAAFSAVVLPDMRRESTDGWRSTAPFDVETNRLGDGRLVVILMDDASPGGGWGIRTAKDVGRAIIEALHPADIAAVVYHVRGDRGQDFTTDRGRLLAAVDRFTGAYAGRVRVSDFWPLVDALAAVPQRRKIVIYLSAGMNFDPEVLARASQPGPMMDVQFDQLETFTHMQELFRRSQRANVNFYAVDLVGLEANPDRDLNERHRDFLRIVANETGGRAIVNTNAPAPLAPRILEENGSYYLLAYQPPPTTAPGRYRRLEVKVRRDNVEVRSRRGYVTPAPPDLKLDPPPPLRQMLTAVMPNPDLPMTLAVAPFASDRRGLTALAVTLGLDIPAGDGRANDLDVALSLVDMDGKEVAARRETATLNPRATPDGRFRFQILTRFDVRPGTYGLRASAVSKTHDVKGSVFADGTAPDFSRGPLVVSGVVIEHAVPLTSVPKDALAALVPATPTTLRSFGIGDRVVAHGRVYQPGRGDLAPATVRTTVLDAEGAVAAETTETFSPERFDDLRSAAFQVIVPTAQLRPGEHLLKIDVSAGRRAVERVIRFNIH